jgi:CPA1 family monovalent cation:H+ antiporter
MNAPELLVGLLMVMCFVALFAERAHIAYPVAFLMGGIAVGFVPDLPQIRIPPAYILVLFLPPLLMEAAFFTSLRDFRFNLRPILQLSFGLVIITSAAVAYLFEKILPNGGWLVGFVLGAIISPPDAVAATAIIRRLNVPKRISAILEGESLLNDATGLVLYRMAVAGVVSGSFSVADAAGHFVFMAIAGCAIGIVTGLLFLRIFPRILEPSVEIISTFLVPYVAFLLAELVHASGVLSVVCAGLVVGWFSPSVFLPHQRLPLEAVWRMVTFVLNGVVFMLIGLTFPEVMRDLVDYTMKDLLIGAALVCGVTVLVRMLYVFGVIYGSRFFFPSIRRKDPYPAWQNVFVIGWTGMRGVVSLATALALPYTIADGSEFPHRSLIIFLAFSVIIFTLVFQGLTLPLILKLLPLRFNPDIIWEDWRARVESAKRALEHVERSEPEDPAHHAAWVRVRDYYQYRLQSLGDGPYTPLFPSEQPISGEHPLVLTEKKMWQQAIEAERETVIGMRKKFEIGDDIMHDIMRELDLLQNRFS